MRRWGVIAACLAVLAASAAPAYAGQPVRVDFEGHASILFTEMTSPGPCNGAPIYASGVDAMALSWHDTYYTTIENDDLMGDEPGWLNGHDIGTQTEGWGATGGDGSPGCEMTKALSISACPGPVQADFTPAYVPHLTDPDRAARKPPTEPFHQHLQIQGPLHLGDDNPLLHATIGCELGFNDLSMLNPSLPGMFTADVEVPFDPFWDNSKGQEVDQWSTDVGLGTAYPIDGSTCGAGNNGVAFVDCSKDVQWSGTVTIARRLDDCSDGATEANPPKADCPPAKPVKPYSSVTAVSSGGGTVGGALKSGSVSASATLSGPGTVDATLSAPDREGAHGAATRRRPSVVADAHVVSATGGKVKLRLLLNRRGRTLLRSWHRGVLALRLFVTLRSPGGHRGVTTRTIKLRRG